MAPNATRYDQDVYTWALETAERLRQQKWDTIDWDAVIEEIEAVGISQQHAVQSRLMQNPAPSPQMGGPIGTPAARPELGHVDHQSAPAPRTPVGHQPIAQTPSLRMARRRIRSGRARGTAADRFATGGVSRHVPLDGRPGTR